MLRYRMPTCNIMALVNKSEYLMGLSAESQARYEAKSTSFSLKTDPYCIDEAPETIPDVQWSDVFGLHGQYSKPLYS